MTTAGERRKLKSRGQKLETILTVGRSGITEAVVSELRATLSRTDLVKVRVNITDRNNRKNAIADLVTQVEGECVGSVGRTCLVYRELPPAADNMAE